MPPVPGEPATRPRRRLLGERNIQVPEIVRNKEDFRSQFGDARFRSGHTLIGKKEEPKTYGEPFIKPKSNEGLLEQMPSRPGEHLGENLPDTQKH
jgi:hypothetical protein